MPASARKILLAEDDRFLADMYRTKLLLEGYQVVHAADGKKAISLLDFEPYDAAVLDILMPGASGLEVLTAIRNSPNAHVSRMPVVIVSNIGSDADIRNSLVAGASDYILKPGTTPAEVVRTIAKTLTA